MWKCSENGSSGWRYSAVRNQITRKGGAARACLQVARQRIVDLTTTRDSRCQIFAEVAFPGGLCARAKHGVGWQSTGSAASVRLARTLIAPEAAHVILYAR